MIFEKPGKRGIVCENFVLNDCRIFSHSIQLSKIISEESEGKSLKKRERGGRGRAAPRQRITYKVPSEMIQPDYQGDEDEDDEIIDVEQFISSDDDSDWNSDSR